MPFDVGAQTGARRWHPGGEAASRSGSQLEKRLGSLRVWRQWAVLLLAWICAPVTASELELPSLLVDAEWLERKLGHPDLVLLDARPAAEYQESHIERAVSLPYTDTIAVHGDYKLIVSLSKAKELFSSAGVARDKTVVVYDGGDATQASRLFWVLEAYGHRKIAVLDGGLAYWASHSLPVSSVPTAPARTEFIPEPQADRIATKLSTRLALNNPNIALIDSRVAAEFLGSKSKTPIPGRIPDAVNVPWPDNLAKLSGLSRYKTSQDLARLYAFVGSRKAISYCNSGNEATLTYFVLRLLGLSPAVYDGSWAEWSMDSEMPKVLVKSKAP